MMRNHAFLAVLLLLLLGIIPSASGHTAKEYLFSINNNNNNGNGNQDGQLRRQRRTASAPTTESSSTTKATRVKIVKRESKMIKPTNEQKFHDHTQEEQDFWNRLLQQDGSVVVPRPTPTPPRPTPSQTQPTGPPPTQPAPAPTRPAKCPVQVAIECVTLDGSIECQNLEELNCRGGEIEVEYSYRFINTRDSVERIYSLVITRDGETEDLTNTFPVTDLDPGDEIIVIENAMLNCEDLRDAIETEAAFVVGPPSEIQVGITCESEQGDECRSLPAATTPAECLIDITYTYAVSNIGNVDANIILFTRTRNGEFRDLIGLLDDTFLPIGAGTSVQESEEIDRCVQQSFATNTIVAQIPNANLLCDDIGFYPI